jgi:hypothetical protein
MRFPHVVPTPRRLGTPSITTRALPAPSIRAPILVSTAASSITSGSRAAFSRMVSPSARQAAIITFWVPFTVQTSKATRAPRRRSLEAST